MMARVIVDHRERSSGIIKELAKRKLDVEVKQLVAADFIIETKDKNGIIHNVGIEKKIDDYYTLKGDRKYPRKSLRIRKKKGIYEVNFKINLSF